MKSGSNDSGRYQIIRNGKRKDALLYGKCEMAEEKGLGETGSFFSLVIGTSIMYLYIREGTKIAPLKTGQAV